MPKNNKSKRVDMPKKRVVALYMRLAREDDNAAEQQETMLRGYAENHGYRNVLAYVDNGVSGIGFDRPALNRLQEDIAAGRISTVIVRDLSRLSRRVFDVPDWISGIRRKGVSFISVMDGVTDDSFEDKGVLFQHFVEALLKQ